MFAHTFRSLHARFDASGIGAVFSPRKPRSPLLRLGLGLLGLALLALLLVVGMAVGALVLVGGLVTKLVRALSPPGAARQAGDTRVVDGEYRVVRKPVLPLTR